MRKWMVSFIALWAAAAYAQDKAPPGDVNDRILEELRQLRAEVAELKKMIRDFEQRSKKTDEPSGPRDFTERRADRQALSRIKLSENPTREEMLKGSDEELRAFYETHKGRFRWDKERRKFVIERP